MVYILLIAMLVGIYDGWHRLNMTHNGIIPGVQPSKNLVNFLLLDKRE